jgi:hypothetical protein
MADWVAVPGQVAVSDKACPVDIAFDDKKATVTPPATYTGAFPYTGVVHIPLPSAPNGMTNVKAMNINTNRYLLDITPCSISNGSNVPCTSSIANPSIWTISPPGSGSQNGWTVNLTLTFFGPTSNLEIEDCKLEFV